MYVRIISSRVINHANVWSMKSYEGGSYFTHVCLIQVSFCDVVVTGHFSVCGCAKILYDNSILRTSFEYEVRHIVQSGVNLNSPTSIIQA